MSLFYIKNSREGILYMQQGGILSGIKKISKDMKAKIQPYINSSSKYRSKSGIVTGLTKPRGLDTRGSGFGANKDGFFVYTHRARSKAHEDPMKITKKEIDFIQSTG
jgi:hypothetical protein